MAKLYGEIAAKTLLTLDKSFARANGQPLDASEVYYSLEAAKTYAATAQAYIGQKIVVVEDGVVTHYSVEDAAGNLKELGSKPVGDQNSIVIAEDGTISLKGIGSLIFERDVVDPETSEPTGQKESIQYQPLMTKNGLIWVEPSKTTVEGLAVLIENLDGRVGTLEKWKNEFVDQDTTYSVKEGEKILSLDGTEFGTALKIAYNNNKIQLLGIGDELISEFDASAFTADGVLEDVHYDVDSKNLTFTWNIITGEDESGNPIYKTDEVNIADLIDTYTAGNGLDLTDAEFSVKIDSTSETFLSVGENGVKLAGVQEAINAAEGRAASDAETKAGSAKEAAIAAAKAEAESLANKAKEDAIDAIPVTSVNTAQHLTLSDKQVGIENGYSLLSENDQAKLSKMSLVGDDVKTLVINGKIQASDIFNLESHIGYARETWQGLYPSADADKLAGIAAGAEVNKIAHILVNGEELTPNNKAVNIPIPVKVSSLENDKNFISSIRTQSVVKNDQDQVISEPWLIIENDNLSLTSIGYVVNDSVVQDKVNTAQAKANEAYALADEAIVGVKLGNETFEVGSDKFATISQSKARTALGLGNLAYQDSIDIGVSSVELMPGSVNGSIKLKVNGVVSDDIGVEGLNNMAYQNTNSYYTRQNIAKIIGYNLDEGETIPGDGSRLSILDEIKKLSTDIGNVSNIMNFRGVVYGSEAGFDEDVKIIEEPKDGDVILYGEQEYVYSDGAWVLFGDASANASAITALGERIDSVINTEIPEAIANALDNYKVKSVVSGHAALTVSKPDENGQITISFADEIILNGGKANIESTT